MSQELSNDEPMALDAFEARYHTGETVLVFATTAESAMLKALALAPGMFVHSAHKISD